jgi:hypothetical protein
MTRQAGSRCLILALVPGAVSRDSRWAFDGPSTVGGDKPWSAEIDAADQLLPPLSFLVAFMEAPFGTAFAVGPGIADDDQR